MTTIKRIHYLPSRWLAPCEDDRSEELVEDCLDDENLKDTLKRYAEDLIDNKQLAYEIQIIMESNYNRRFNPPKEELED